MPDSVPAPVLSVPPVPPVLPEVSEEAGGAAFVRFCRNFSSLAASVFCGYLLKQMEKRKLEKVLLMSTGALLSTTSPFQGESIPGITHAISLEVE